MFRIEIQWHFAGKEKELSIFHSVIEYLTAHIIKRPMQILNLKNPLKCFHFVTFIYLVLPPYLASTNLF